MQAIKSMINGLFGVHTIRFIYFLGKNRERSALRSSIRNKQNDNKNSILWMHLILL